MEIKKKTADDYREERNYLLQDVDIKTRKLGIATRKIAAMDLALRMAIWNIQLLHDSCMTYRPAKGTIPMSIIQTVREYEPEGLVEWETIWEKWKEKNDAE